jgi:hypothetical protein
MDLISLHGKTNIFEKRVSEYSKANINHSSTPETAETTKEWCTPYLINAIEDKVARLERRSRHRGNLVAIDSVYVPPEYQTALTHFTLEIMAQDPIDLVKQGTCWV